MRKLNEALPQHVVKSNKQYYDTISKQFASVSRDLQGLNGFRYARQISGGCQEYLEAASFEHYLATGTLLSYEDAAAQQRKLDAEGPGVDLSPEDYLLGIFDMTGELMRFAITAMATSGSLPSVDNRTAEGTASERNVLDDLRGIRSALESLNAGSNGPFAKDVEKKMEVMRNSVEKVERSLYESFRERLWLSCTDMLVDMASLCVERSGRKGGCQIPMVAGQLRSKSELPGMRA